MKKEKSRGFSAAALVFLLGLTVLLVSCGSGGSKVERVSTRSTPEWYATGAADDGRFDVPSAIPCDADGYYFCNLSRSVGKPPFPIPDDAESNGNGSFIAAGLPDGVFEIYLAVLQSKGFAIARTQNGVFLFRDDCAARVSNNDQQMELFWYQTSDGAPKGGVSPSDAASLLLPANSLCPIPLLPIDVTPKGFYERSGGQIFAVPEYTFDRNIASGFPERNVPENASFTFSLHFVKGDRTCQLTFGSVAVLDADRDGDEEVLIPSIETEPRVIDLSTLSPDELAAWMSSSYTSSTIRVIKSVTFAERDGRLTLLVTQKEYQEWTDAYDLAYEVGDEGWTVGLRSEKSAPLFLKILIY